MGKNSIALTLEQKKIIATFMIDNPIMSQGDVARTFSVKYNRCVSKSVIHRIFLKREKFCEPGKSNTKFRETISRFPDFEGYVMDELKNIQKNQELRRG